MVFAFLSLNISARCPDRSPKSPSRFQIYEPENGQCPRESTLLVHPEFCCAGDGARDPAHAELRLTLLRTVQLLARPTRAHSNSLSPCAAVSSKHKEVRRRLVDGAAASSGLGDVRDRGNREDGPILSARKIPSSTTWRPARWSALPEVSRSFRFEHASGCAGYSRDPHRIPSTPRTPLTCLAAFLRVGSSIGPWLAHRSSMRYICRSAQGSRSVVPWALAVLPGASDISVSPCARASVDFSPDLVV